MAMLPSRVKHRKTHRGSRAGNATVGNKVSYGEFGLQTLERAWIKNTQIEACRVAITRHLKRKGSVYIRIFPHKPVTARPPETRMGKGKGAPEFWVAVVYPGTMLFEVAGVSEALARDACRLAANKLGVRTRFVTRQAMH
ncbi:MULTISPECIES: 50S ribosomal protein L16 [Verrucomicrobium]|jgi:large subunit ribosomal protein L16|uniref:50S ribosomal protein L16 n=1 Tax=Verrucomicrobium TaxID=2735 RepID=UPI000492AB16|nr:50S ribosomal protein L16 [Verrucomicrobium spinosum]